MVEDWLPTSTLMVYFARGHTHPLGFLSALLVHAGSRLPDSTPQTSPEVWITRFLGIFSIQPS